MRTLQRIVSGKVASHCNYSASVLRLVFRVLFVCPFSTKRGDTVPGMTACQNLSAKNVMTVIRPLHERVGLRCELIGKQEIFLKTDATVARGPGRTNLCESRQRI